MKHTTEEGDKCPSCQEGQMEFTRTSPCSCHINPPCSACTDAPLVCNSCGFEVNPRDEQVIHEHSKTVAQANVWWQQKRRTVEDLDPTKIDWIVSSTGYASMTKKGVYPPSASQDDVYERVKGSFGGRFTYFGGGRFTFIAYTD